MAHNDAIKAPRERNEGAATTADDPNLKVTITLPRSMLLALDERVLERKRSDRGMNRSALIQSAIDAFLANDLGRGA